MYFFIIFAIVSTCYGLTYRNYALLHGSPQNERELKFFHDMAKLYNVTFWRRPGKIKGPVEFTISPKSYDNLMYDTYPTKIRFRTIMEDVQSAFDKQTIKRYIKRHLDSFSWNSYHSLDDIYNWMKDLSAAYPDYVQLLHIGKSFENRDIFAVKLKLNKVTCQDRPRPKVIVEGGTHGREWISPAVVTFMIHALLHANKSNSEDLQMVAPMYDWIFVPVMNPDGYVYSQTTDRLWHKNRRGGHGVDLNRNFGVVFGRHGAKDKENAEYCGRAAFSEPETAAMATLARDNSASLEYYLSFHSYGQYIIIPYSFSTSHEDNYSSTKKLLDMVAERMYTKYGVQYEVGTNYDTQGYLASGVSADWAKRALNATYVATFMLPDAGEYGYALPTDKILLTCQATMDGLLAFLDPPNPEKPREPRGVKLTDSEDLEDDDPDPDPGPDPDEGALGTHASTITFFIINVVVYVLADFIRE